MRIGLDGTDPLRGPARGAAKASAPASKAAEFSEQDSYTHDNLSSTELTGRALQSASVRWDKVDDLRQSISSGQYRLDPHSIAEAMLKG